jgi:hypothetical protein
MPVARCFVLLSNVSLFSGAFLIPRTIQVSLTNGIKMIQVVEEAKRSIYDREPIVGNAIVRH